MPLTRWNERFFASTRGQVVALLRRGLGTVEDLAQALGLTDNAVRAHLTALERDGLVVQRGLRRGVGKPAYTYELTPDAERLFPKAYGALLHLLLDALAERLSPDALEALLRDVGHRLVEGHAPPTGNLQTRVEDAVELLGELGGLADVEARDDGFVILGRSCPLAAAVEGHPQACLLAEALLADVVGVPVRQTCDPDGPRCRFEVGTMAALTGGSPELMPGS
ncbi:MAG: ArsR family transcriptional regulator [Chloroflexi bacterium]|nr:ArsR family transcriptional regulator [Chloroflexota bacterium]